MTEPTPAISRWSLAHSVRLGTWLKLPEAVMRDVGPAAQTLGGLFSITGRETFVSRERIAVGARLPLRTTASHLARLVERGWLAHRGRQRHRRTVTYSLTSQTRAALRPFGALPWWATESLVGLGRLPWCARAVLSVVMARKMALDAVIARHEDEGYQGSTDPISHDRYRFRLRDLEEQTGLRREAVVNAKAILAAHGIVGLVRNDDWRGAPTIILPNDRFRIAVEETGHGRLLTVEFAESD